MAHVSPTTFNALILESSTMGGPTCCREIVVMWREQCEPMLFFDPKQMLDELKQEYGMTCAVCGEIVFRRDTTSPVSSMARPQQDCVNLFARWPRAFNPETYVCSTNGLYHRNRRNKSCSERLWRMCDTVLDELGYTRLANVETAELEQLVQMEVVLRYLVKELESERMVHVRRNRQLTALVAAA
jgi:hypothetical protein